MGIERTFAILKPGVLQRRLAGEILSRLEKKGFNIIALKLTSLSREIVEKHYAEHKGKEFYEPLLEYMMSSPVMLMILERENAIKALRNLAGATNVDEASPGTLRGDFGVITRRNLIHASDSPESAEREIKLFFSREEIHPFIDGNARWY